MPDPIKGLRAGIPILLFLLNTCLGRVSALVGPWELSIIGPEEQE